ncbi:MAG TPA: PHP domain-containing protein [Patescibacteria group bacterium]|nr:PHP domain-containing protein [Patescibacteria group bacterium]
MTLYADYHTHTIYSHGKGTIMDNVMAARSKGLTELAITDHGIRHFTFGVKKKNIAKMRDEIDRINEHCDGVKVLLGMECNIISSEGDIDMNDEIRKYLDILLVGYHMMVMPKGLKDVWNIYGLNYLEKFFSYNTEKVKEKNTISIAKAIEKHKIDIITHPGARIPIDTTYIAQIAAKAGTALEINSHSSAMTAEHVKAAAKYGVKFVINSDAHRPEDVGRLDNGLRIALEAGLDSSQIINAVK